MKITYKGKNYIFNKKKFIKHVVDGLEFLFVFITYYIVLFNMLVTLIEKYS